MNTKITLMLNMIDNSTPSNSPDFTPQPITRTKETYLNELCISMSDFVGASTPPPPPLQKKKKLAKKAIENKWSLVSTTPVHKTHTLVTLKHHLLIRSRIYN